MNRSEMLKRLEAGEDALELSIEKWQDIVDGKGKNYDSLNCALCESIPTCKLCIIFKKTGESDCEETPYEKYDEAHTTKQRKKYALEELEFLKSLRKKEVQ